MKCFVCWSLTIDVLPECRESGIEPVSRKAHIITKPTTGMQSLLHCRGSCSDYYYYYCYVQDVLHEWRTEERGSISLPPLENALVESLLSDNWQSTDAYFQGKLSFCDLQPQYLQCFVWLHVTFKSSSACEILIQVNLSPVDTFRLFLLSSSKCRQVPVYLYAINMPMRIILDFFIRRRVQSSWTNCRRQMFEYECVCGINL